MIPEHFHMYAYWGPREETARACAERLARLIEDLADHDARLFGRWNRQGGSQHGQPLCSVPPNIDRLTEVVVKGLHHGDVMRKPIPRLGFSLFLGNGGGKGPFAAGLQLNVGAFTPHQTQPNLAKITLAGRVPENADILTVEWLRPVLLIFARVWEPDWITVFPTQTHSWIKERDGVIRWPFGGWMVYLKPAWAVWVVPPAGCTVEPQPDGAALLIATEEPFTFDNPEHAAAFDALRLSLAPLWPDLDEPPSPRRR